MENLGIIVWLTLALTSAVLCYKLAAKNKLNTSFAAVIGFLAPVLSPIIYTYINSGIYRKLHSKPGRSSGLKKWSLIIGGVLLIFIGFTSSNDAEPTQSIIWITVLTLVGIYLIWQGFTKHKDINKDTNK